MRRGTGGFACLSSEIAILRRDFPAAERAIKEPLPDGTAFDAVRAYQRLLAAKLQIERGQFRSGHDTLSQARSLATGDAAIALEIDRLDGQVLLRMGEWNSGEALLNTVVTRAAATSDRYHQATALNDLGRGLMAPQPVRRSASLFRAGRGDAGPAESGASTPRR